MVEEIEQNQFVDFSKVKSNYKYLRHSKNNTSRNTKSETPSYMCDGKPVVYDSRTMNYYKTLRQCQLDPFLNISVNPNYVFKFFDQWNSYTGERIGHDPFGPLCFDPTFIIYNFYIHRLDGLWHDAFATKDGYFEGYYDMLVGSGEELEVVGREKYTERYLFRLPIYDCYLTPDHNKSLVTISPKLNDEEINELENLSQTDFVQKEYFKNFNAKCPSVKKLKTYYDNAIAKTVNVSENISSKYEVPQNYYVDLLRSL